MEKVLVVEDERSLNTMICDYLEAVGYETIPVYDGLSALRTIREKEPGFILLDIMLPGIEGTDLLRRIREFSPVPVILLTARADEADKLLGLELGADDYITKPFSLKELVARIRAVSRRSSGGKFGGEEKILTHGVLTLDPFKRTVSRNGQTLNLTSVQFDILTAFLKNPGRVFSRMDLLNAFQENAFEGYERTIDVHIKNIRKILESDPAHPRFIITVRGVGYKLSEEEDR
jgi:DNA-binding response OmpR family regulator